MARVSHKRVKQLLNEHRSKITDKQFFTSRILAGHYEDVAAAQSKRYRYDRRVRVNIYWNPNDPNGASTNNTNILINAGHPCVTKIRGRMDRYEMVSGLFAHELGHVLYTDFLAKQTYLNYLERYKWYPAPPDLKTTRDAANERDFWEYVKLDKRNMEFAMLIASFIANVLEDGYIENRILSEFPGVLGYNLSVMREHQYKDISTVTQLIEREDDGTSHIFHSILQIMLSYVLYGEIKYDDTPLSDERIQTVFQLIPQLDESLTTTSAKERWKTVSLIMVRCWHHIEDYIELCKKHQDEAMASGGSGSSGEVLSGLLQAIAGASAEGTGSGKPVAGSESVKGIPIRTAARARTQELARKNQSGNDGEKTDESGAPGSNSNESGSNEDSENPSEETPNSGQTDSEIVPDRMALTPSVPLWMVPMGHLASRKPRIKKAGASRSTRQIRYPLLLAVVPSMTTTISGN